MCDFCGLETVFFETVCSLTKEERRKRNVGGIVCGIFEVYSFEISKKNMAARFLREDVNTGSSNDLLDWCVKYVLVDSSVTI